MEEALLVVLGSLLGAAGSVAGSIVVNRRELTRSYRIRLYSELLPAVRAAAGAAVGAVEDNPNPPPPDLRALREAARRLAYDAAITGRREATLARTVSERVGAALEVAGRLSSSTTWNPGAFIDGVVAVLEALEPFESHLREKIR